MSPFAQISVRRSHVERHPFSVALNVGVLRERYFSHGRLFRVTRLDGGRDRPAQLEKHVAELRDVGERRWEPVTRYHYSYVERENTAEYGDEAVQVAIAEPGKAAVEQEIAEEHDPAPFEMHNDVAVRNGPGRNR